jgi:outer membrane protein assembly factor BamD (BamD/ComL family)
MVQVTELQNAENRFDQRKYSDAVNAYRKILTASPAPTPVVAANAQYGIAFILAYYDNPQRNYAQAVQELDELMRLYPDNARVREAQNLRFILKAIIEIKKENEHLNKSIEQLKKLDIRHEERRGGK